MCGQRLESDFFAFVSFAFLPIKCKCEISPKTFLRVFFGSLDIPSSSVRKGCLGSGSVCNYPIAWPIIRLAGQVAALHNKTGARQMTPRVKAGKWSTINGDKQEKLAIRISSKTDIKLHREGLRDIKKAFCGLCHNNCTRNIRLRANWPFFSSN